MPLQANRFFRWIMAGALILLAIILIFNFWTDENSTEEWLYTLKWINAILISILAILICLIIANLLKPLSYSKTGWLVIFAISVVLFAVPAFSPNYQLVNWRFQYFLSADWVAAFLVTGIALFLAATRSTPIMASVWCIFGSLFIGVAALEAALLLTSQYQDGIANLSAQSKYASNANAKPEYDSWVASECGRAPAAAGSPSMAYHRQQKFDKILYDVKYEFNAAGWRATPESKANPDDNLMLFGCSFTFGHGLDNEQTWAWKLATSLGPDWKIENYGGNAYSPYHMLCLLEHGLVSDVKAQNRYAIFLSIEDHLRRNDFFPDTPHYGLSANGEPIRGGKPKFNWAYNLPVTFNGSQLARQIADFIHAQVMKHPQPLIALYLATVKKAAQILKDKYHTQLIILLWPDFEYVKEDFEKAGITVLMARSLLPDWDKGRYPGSIYAIDEMCEGHPNPKATSEIAAGLAKYLQALVNKGPTVNLHLSSSQR